MSEHDYAQFEGKKVRATSGENVLVGVFGIVNSVVVYVDVDTIGPVSIVSHEWKLELIRELPTRKGAVIRVENGDIMVNDGKARQPWINLEAAADGWCDPDEIEGDFTVLFEGVDA